jgi:phage gp29-like protein
MGAPSKRAKKIRVAKDFDLVALAAELRTPKVSSGLYAWDLTSIRAARDEQMLGYFQQPARLVEATRTDYAIFASFLNRLAPQRGLPIRIEPAGGARGARIASEAEALFGRKGIGIKRDTLADIDGCLANHGVAFAVNVVTPREDGSRVDFEVKYWPIEFVRWDPVCRSFKTLTENGGYETITHADGRWIVFQEHESEPWKFGAILPLALVWADHAFGVRDRAKSSNAHGNAKWVGALPEGVPLEDETGQLTREGKAFLQLLRDVASADMPVGIKPFGATVDYIVNNSTQWQIFKEIIDSGDKSADRVYLGHDSEADSVGGDMVSYLFDVRNDIVEGALRAIETGLREGTIEPWAAINFGDSTFAPERCYLMPDADQDARLKSLGERYKLFHDTIAQAITNKFDVTQDYVNKLAKEFDITAPTLPVISSIPTPSVAGTPPTPTPSPTAVPSAPPKLAVVP